MQHCNYCLGRLCCHPWIVRHSPWHRAMRSWNPPSLVQSTHWKSISALIKKKTLIPLVPPFIIKFCYILLVNTGFSWGARRSNSFGSHSRLFIWAVRVKCVCIRRLCSLALQLQAKPPKPFWGSHTDRWLLWANRIQSATFCDHSWYVLLHLVICVHLSWVAAPSRTCSMH